MFGKNNLVLVLEDYDLSFSVRLMDRDGLVYSDNRFMEKPSLSKIRSLVSALTQIFGNFNRVTYSKNFQKVWDHEARPDAFGKFLAEMFTSHEAADPKYSTWEHFSEFLTEQKREAKNKRLGDLPF
ncbi:hypothetical protein [Planococcus ruber]|uniref:hypothetical protein n=1 Tax=Planococcus ruber TaxID=2027871 RepID=UPI001FED989B|nr:hypothetical protein [Planococcus ruber]MCJ1908308.1 hypothetical protein [Planococcus ruber]